MSASRVEVVIWPGDDPEAFRFSSHGSNGYSFLSIGKLGSLNSALLGFGGDNRLQQLEALRDATAEHIAQIKAQTPPALVEG